MKPIAIFGSKGYLGKQLVHYFSQRDAAVEEFDIPECDITNVSFWEFFDPSRYSAILFFAGLTGTERGFSEAHQYLTVNEGGLLYLLQKLAPLGGAAPKVIFPSTRLVYKGANKPLCEDAEKETKTVYAVNKLSGEGCLEAFSNRFGIPYVACRICVPYGSLIASDYSYGTIGFFMKQAQAGQSITLYDGGWMRRTFTHVLDVCTIIDRLLKRDVKGVFNIGGCDYELAEVARLIAGRYGVGVVSVPYPPAAALLETGSTCLDSTKLAEVIGDYAYQDIKAHVAEM